MKPTAPKSSAAIVRVPMPVPFETPSSWITRFALTQGAKLSEIISFLDLKGSDDMDMSFSQLNLAMLSKKVGANLTNLHIAQRILSNIQRIDPHGRKFMLQDAGSGQFRYCSKCFSEQVAYHVPIHWRISTWRHCPLHNCLMDTGCPHCGAITQLPADLICAGPKRKGVAYLNRCVRCDKSLTALGICKIPTDGPGSIALTDLCLLKNGRATLAALYFGHLIIGDDRKRQGLHALLTLYNKGLLPRSQKWLDPKVVRERMAKRQASPDSVNS